MEPRYLNRCWAEIDLSALISNAEWIINQKQENEKIMAIVKANAYGCGASMVAKTLYEYLNINNFAVANIYEARKLRRDKIEGEILILGYTPFDQLGEIVDLNLCQTALNGEYAYLLNEKAASLGIIVPIHIAIDTGMNRIGFLENEDFRKLYKHKNLLVKGAYTHLCHADSLSEDAKEYTLKQIEIFKRRTKGINNLHCQNSAAIITKMGCGFDYIRPGIILYGLNPSEEVNCSNLKQVLSLKSIVSMTKQIEKGATIGYGRSYIAKNKMRIATIPVGYADGYPRLLSNKGNVLINGKRCKVVGNVCMDQLMVDVSHVKCEMGDVVTLIGEDNGKTISSDELATQINTIGYEIISNLSPRVPRVYLKENRVVKVEYF